MAQSYQWDRRSFFTVLAAAGGAIAFNKGFAAESQKPVIKEKIKLGFDNFSIRACKWKAPQLLDHADKLKVDSLFISDLEAYESLDESYLKQVKEKADRLGIDLHAGTGSICPSSNSFNPKHGTAEEHLALVIKVAKTLGSPVARCFLGSFRDRENGGIYKHIENTVKVCKACRNLAVDSGVRIAIENHAGDMQAWELAMLIEEAGKDYVGATIDPGNAVWSLEDPMINLEILGPYIATTGMRDSCVREFENGAVVQWAGMGDGQIDWKKYVERFAELAPGITFQLEIIANIWDRELPYFNEEFWSAYPKARASEFAQFVEFAKRGKPYQVPAGRPTGEDSPELQQKQQLFDLERSIKYCKEQLGLGVRA